MYNSNNISLKLIFFQIRVTETSSTLHISEAFPEDTGMYTVKAYNKYGMTQCKAKLTVLGKKKYILSYYYIN